MTKDTIQAKINKCIDEIAQTADVYPGVVIIHNLKTLTIAWMSQRGLTQLGTTLREMVGTSVAEYHDRYFNPEDAKDYAPKIYDFLKRNNDNELLTNFQQVRTQLHGDWAWHVTSTRILMKDEDGSPLLVISFSFPMDEMHHMTAKAERLLEENNFLRHNFESFSKLSNREREILRFLAMGKSAAQTSEHLFIAVNTVETHRKNIRQKLGVSTFYELCQYARAFDLI